MYALTLWRPWALFVCTGEKRIENRPWAPPLAMLGKTIAIHAGAYWDQDAVHIIRSTTGVDVMAQLQRGHHELGIIGTAQIAGWCDARGKVLQNVRYIRWELTKRDRQWLTGPFGWILRDAHLLRKAIPCRGKQKLWRVPETVELQLRNAA